MLHIFVEFVCHIFVFHFTEKIWLHISCESSALILFSQKMKKNYFRMLLASILIGALKVHPLLPSNSFTSLF